MSLPLDTGGGQGFTSIPKGYDGASTWIIASADCISRSKAKNRLYRLLDKSRFARLGPTVADGLKREFYLHLDAWLQCEEVRFFRFRVHSFAFTKCF